MCYEIESIIDRFPPADSCEYELNVVCNYNGELLYQLYDDVSGLYFEYNEHAHAFDTIHLCKMLKLDEETTFMWVIMFGHRLPEHINQL